MKYALTFLLGFWCGALAMLGSLYWRLLKDEAEQVQRDADA